MCIVFRILPAVRIHWFVAGIVYNINVVRRDANKKDTICTSLIRFRTLTDIDRDIQCCITANSVS